MKKTILLFAAVVFNSAFLCAQHIASNTTSKEQPTYFTQADRDRLVIIDNIDKRLIRMEATLEQFMKATDQRFEQMDRRFEESRSDMNARFEQTNTYIGWLIVMFAAITSATIGFAIWDRRTMIRPFETKVKEIDIAIEQLVQEKTANKILTALRELSKRDEPLAEVLRTYNLL